MLLALIMIAVSLPFVVDGAIASIHTFTSEGR